MSSLPEEIYLEILPRVPVKSTFVCKCVCKSWFSIISDPDFVKLHLDLTTKRNNCSLLVKPTDKAFKLYSSYDDAYPVELETHKYSLISTTLLLGSCNGLVYGCNSGSKSYYLWNPATKEYKRLPKSQSEFYFYNSYALCHGFGYDHKTDDYKLVKINRQCYEAIVSVEVYSLKSNSWRSLGSIQYYFHYHLRSGVPFNGTLHWLGGKLGKTSSKMIVSMDIGEEKFGELQLPITLQTTQHYRNMGVLEGCLCVFARNRETFEVWVMQEYGVPASWNKLYTISYESIMCCSFSLGFIGSLKNDEILFADRCNVVSYDPMYGTARKTEINDLDGGVTVKYFESLVSLNSLLQEETKREKALES